MATPNASVVSTADEIPNEKTATDQNESKIDNESASVDVVTKVVKMQVGEGSP